MPTTIIEGLMSEFAGTLVNEDEHVCGMIAETNAYGWGLDVYDDAQAQFTNPQQSRIDFSITLTLSGDQHDAAFMGDSMDLEIKGTAEFNGSTWDIKDYEILSSKVNND